MAEHQMQILVIRLLLVIIKIMAGDVASFYPAIREAQELLKHEGAPND